MAENCLWLVIWLSLEALRHGARILGSPGSGKSVLLNAFRASIARLMARRPGYDVLVMDHDAKGDLYRVLPLLPPHCATVNPHPFVWGDVYDFFGDIADPRDLFQASENLVRVDPQETQKFFGQAAQQVSNGHGLRHWIVARDVAGFADLVRPGVDISDMRLVLKSHPLTKRVAMLITDNECGLSVASTLTNAMARYEIVAALWESNDRGRKESVSSFVNRRFGWWLLPYDDRSLAVLSSINRYILLVTQQRLLSVVKPARFFVIIADELSLMPSGIDLDLTVVKGREGGVIPVLAYQSQMHARSIHSKDRFDSMTGLMKSTVVLNLPNVDDAEYAAKIFASHQGYLRVESYSGGKGGGFGWSEQLTTIENVTAPMIQSLPIPTPNNPVIEGFMATIPFKPFRFRIHIPDLVREFLPAVPPAAPPAPRSPRDMVLRPWTADGRKRLRLR